MDGVVVGLDDSKDARAALAWALGYAQSQHQPLTAVTVVDPLIATAMWDDTPGDNRTNTYLAAARRDVERMVEEAVTQTSICDVPVSIEARMGHPVKELVRAAEGADLLVVGSRGVGSFARLLLGSTSTGVAHHAPCSVTIVRAGDSAGPGASDAKRT